MICHFSNIWVHFVFSKLNFVVLFPFLIKYYHILFIIIVFWLGCARPSGHLLFKPALLLSILTPLFLPSSSVSLSYFVLAVPMRECLGKHSCMRSPCPIAILNGTFLFSRGELVCNFGWSLIYENKIKLNFGSFVLFHFESTKLGTIVPDLAALSSWAALAEHSPNRQWQQCSTRCQVHDGSAAHPH